MESVIIRPYQKNDREQVRQISWDTAFMGKPANIFFAGDILTDFLTAYFTDFEPESCFVAQKDGKAIGYLLGAKDTRTMEKIFAEKVLPHLLLKALTGGAFFKKKNIIFMLHLLMGVLRQEFREPDIFKEYPATLHVNISEGFRGQGLGSRLIAAYLDYLTGRGVSGVYLATLSPGAAEFFGKQGFTLAYQGKRSYFRYLLHQDLPIYIYAKKLQ